MLKRIIFIALISSYSFAVDTNTNVQSFISADIGKKVVVSKPAVTVQTKQIETKKNKNLENIRKKEKSWIEKAQENAKNINKISKTLNLPISMKVKPVQENVGSVSWSLVNDKCEPDFNAIFNKSWNDLLNKYKQQIKKMLDPSFLNMWFKNQALDAIITSLADARCLKEISAKPELMKRYLSEYKDCVVKAWNGTTNQETAGYAGTMTGTKGGSTLDLKKIAQAAAQVVNCKSKVASEVFGERFVQCESDTKRQIMGMLNGTANFSIKFAEMEFNKEQQKCILDKQNAELDIKPVDTEFFTIEAKSTDPSAPMGQASFKATPTSSINNIILSNQKVIENFYGTNPFRKYEYLLPYPNYEKIAISKAYNLSFQNWLSYVFASTLGIKTVNLPDKGLKDVKVPVGRWGFDIWLGYDRQTFGLNPFTYNTSIYDECSSIVNGDVNTVLFNPNQKILKENIPDAKYNKTTDAGRWKFFLLHQPALLNNVKVLKKYIPENNEYILKNPEIYNYEMLYLMNLACANWANRYKIQLSNTINEFLNTTATLTTVAPDGKPMPKKQAKEISDFRNNLIKLTEFRMNDLQNLNTNADNKAMYYKKLILEIIKNNPKNNFNGVSNNITYH